MVVETQESGGEVSFGVGRDTSILDASLQAVISAANAVASAIKKNTNPAIARIKLAIPAIGFT